MTLASFNCVDVSGEFGNVDDIVLFIERVQR